MGGCWQRFEVAGRIIVVIRAKQGYMYHLVDLGRRRKIKFIGNNTDAATHKEKAKVCWRYG
jgi:hypothetical protein